MFRQEALYNAVQRQLRTSATPENTFTVKATMPNGDRYERILYSQIDAISNAIDVHLGSRFNDVTVTRHSDGFMVYKR